jgi:hypothetical protein
MGRDLMGVSHPVRILHIEQLTYSAVVLPKASRTAADSSPPNFEIALGLALLLTTNLLSCCVRAPSLKESTPFNGTNFVSLKSAQPN